MAFFSLSVLLLLPFWPFVLIGCICFSNARPNKRHLNFIWLLQTSAGVCRHVDEVNLLALGGFVRAIGFPFRHFFFFLFFIVLYDQIHINQTSSRRARQHSNNNKQNANAHEIMYVDEIYGRLNLMPLDFYMIFGTRCVCIGVFRGGRCEEHCLLFERIMAKIKCNRT